MRVVNEDVAVAKDKAFQLRLVAIEIVTAARELRAAERAHANALLTLMKGGITREKEARWLTENDPLLKRVHQLQDRMDILLIRHDSITAPVPGSEAALLAGDPTIPGVD